MPDFDDSYLLAHTINLNTKTVINQLKRRLTPVLKDGACAAKPVNYENQGGAQSNRGGVVSFCYMAAGQAG